MTVTLAILKAPTLQEAGDSKADRERPGLIVRQELPQQIEDPKDAYRHKDPTS